MTSPTSTQVHHTVGNDLGGTQRPSGELGWGRLALLDGGKCRQEGDNFQQQARTMGEAEMDSSDPTWKEVGGPFASDRNSHSVISLSLRTGSIAKQVAGLEITSTPVLSKQNGNVVFICREVPGGSN